MTTKVKRSLARKPDTDAVLMLRTCGPDGESYGGFRWPLTVGATVEAPDWSPNPCCGGGLHGLPWGEGDGSLLCWDADAVWLVWSAAAADVVAITDGGSGKSKAPRGVVEHVGTRETAAAYVAEHGGAGRAIVAGTATAGYAGTATAGARGTATAGVAGTATAGDDGTVVVRWWDEAAERYRLAIGYVGEDGIEPDVAYRWDATAGRLVKAEV